MNYLKTFVRTFVGKNGQAFARASTKGKFLPKGAIRHSSPIDDEAYYRVEVVGKPWAQGKDGRYQIFFTESWVDERNPDRKIVRVKADTIEYLGLPPKKEELILATFPDEAK